MKQSLKVAKNTVVSVKIKLSDAQGNVLEEGLEPMTYLHGGYYNTLPKIEEVLNGHAVGFKTKLKLEPEDAFGDYDASLLQVEPRSRFPEKLEVGMQFEGIPESDDESGAPNIFTVTDIAEDKVVLDANHPLAGMALCFSLHVTDVRPATKEEIAHQHVHDSYGECLEDPWDEEGDEEADAYRTRVLH